MLETVKQRLSKVTQILMVIVFIAMLMIGWQIISRQQYLPVNADDKTWIEMRIPPNSTAVQVAHLLKEKDLIRSEHAFLKYCKKTKVDSQLQAGLYSLSRSQSLYDIVSKLAEGETIQNNFTIPEGYTLKQIGDLLVKRGVVSRNEWQNALLDKYNYDFLPEQISETRLEGYLFPDTYELTEDITAHEIIDNMLDNFDKHWQREFAELSQNKGVGINEAIIVASLVEKEAQVPAERKRIAGVIYNRLAIGMPLQIDATILYSLGEHKEKITYEDLKVNSPYNTYLYNGLPTGPIACPGIAAIKAALDPEKHTYYYYVSKGNGSHYFSHTFAEHQNAINKYSK